MNQVRDDFPALWQFLGAYLHQDWQDEYTSPQSAFEDFLDGETTLAKRVAIELATLLESGRTEQDLEAFVLEGGSFYLPRNDDITTATWLAGLRDLCPAEGAT